MSLVSIAAELRDAVDRLRFADPVTHVYNPLVYAWDVHQRYLTRYGTGRRTVVLLGMNPGPFGMAQTGVPFGEVAIVRDWLALSGEVQRPKRENPARPVMGLACSKSEVSGARLWGWARSTFGTPEAFFARFFVLNYCPLVFMEASGKNRTPDKLPTAEATPLFAACDRALIAAVKELDAAMVVGVGGFAYDRAETALEGMGVPLGRILHPSPASPLANRGWAEAATRELRALGALSAH
jgi:single-strand selective monofunctional uracil DNA glycosylase